MPFPANNPDLEKQALLKMLTRLRNYCDILFDNPVQIFFCKDYYDWPGPADRPSWNKDAWLILPDDFYYLATVRRRGWFERLRYPDPNHQVMIFSIHPKFYGTAYGRKEINCHVLDPRIRFLADRVLRDYANECNATAINCSGLPGAKSHLASYFNL